LSQFGKLGPAGRSARRAPRASFTFHAGAREKPARMRYRQVSPRTFNLPALFLRSSGTHDVSLFFDPRRV
jgi:hypothetical protein